MLGYSYVITGGQRLGVAQAEGPKHVGPRRASERFVQIMMYRKLEVEVTVFRFDLLVR